ncbi:MAG TPA: L,D-transpeptidase, partial [Afipia sp.]|nr:L,D-transpeptidase [Afipia sp.]
MVDRLTSAKSTTAMRRWGPSAVVMFAAMAALLTPTADAAAKPARRAQPAETAAPREAGEPIMAIVS